MATIHVHIHRARVKDEDTTINYRGVTLNKNSYNGKWFAKQNSARSNAWGIVQGFNSLEELKKEIDKRFTDYQLQPEGDVLMRKIMKYKNEGSAARRAGKTFAANPYSSGIERQAWSNGWREADRGKL